MQRKSDKTIPRYFDYFFNIVHIIQIDRACIISHRFFNSKIYQIRGPVASLLAATLYQGNPDRNPKLWNIVSTGRYILHIATYKWKVHNAKIEIISLVVVSFLTAPHCQFRGVGS